MAEATRRAGGGRQLVRALLTAIAGMLIVRLPGPAIGPAAVHAGGDLEHPATGLRSGSEPHCPPTARARGPPSPRALLSANDAAGPHRHRPPAKPSQNRRTLTPYHPAASPGTSPPPLRHAEKTGE